MKQRKKIVYEIMIFFGLNSPHSENFILQTAMKLNERAKLINEFRKAFNKSLLSNIKLLWVVNILSGCRFLDILNEVHPELSPGIFSFLSLRIH